MEQGAKEMVHGWGLWLLSGIGVWLIPSLAWADCYQLYRSNQPEQAGDCFVQAAKKLGAGKALTEAARIRKGRLLRNAALSYDKAAKSSPNLKASELRDKAVQRIDDALREKLFEGASGLKEMKELRGRLERSIGRVNVTVVTGHANAFVCLQSGEWKRCKSTSLWNLNVLPRRYTVRVRYPGGEQQTKPLQGKPFARLSVVFAPKELAKTTTIVTNDPGATLTLQSSVLKKPVVAKGLAFTRGLKAGTYQVRVLFSNQQSLKRTMVVKQGKSTVLVLQPPGPPVLIVNTTPINAEVHVDGKYRGNSSLRLTLQPGRHVVEVRRGCFQVVRRVIQARPNQTYTIASILQREKVYQRWLTSRQRGSRMSPVGWAVLASGVVIAGVGGLMHGLANGRHDQAEKVRPIRFEEYRQQATEGNTFRTVGYVGLGVGLVGLGAGVTTLLMSRAPTKFQLPCRVRIRPSNDDL